MWEKLNFNFHLAVILNTLQVTCNNSIGFYCPFSAIHCSLWRRRFFFCEVETLQWKKVALKVEAKREKPLKQDLLKLTLKAEVAHQAWLYRRALWNSAIKGESPQQHHIQPHLLFTTADSWSCKAPFSSVKPGASAVSHRCWPLASGLQNTSVSYSSFAGSMVPLLHIYVKCQMRNTAI